MAKEIKNIGASVRARLLSLSRANGQSFDWYSPALHLSVCSSG